MHRRDSFYPALHLVVWAALVSTGAVRAGDIVWDFGPGTGTYNISSWNETGEAEWADDVYFSAFIELTGIDIWTPIPVPVGNAQVKVLFNDPFIPLLPGAEYLRWDVVHTSYEFDGNYNGTDLYKVSFDFDPVWLRADTRYWIGVSGNGWNLGQALIRSPGDGRAAYFKRGQFSHLSTQGDQMFQLRGREVFPPFELALDGQCPGPMTASVIGATPGGRVALLRGQRGGETILTTGRCSGTTIPLGEAALVSTAVAGGEGEVQFSPRLLEGCGETAFAALDLTTCAVTGAQRTYARPTLYTGPRINQAQGLADFNAGGFRSLESYDEGGMNFRYVHDAGSYLEYRYCGGDGTLSCYMREVQDMMGVTRVDGQTFNAIEFNAGDGYVAHCTISYLWIRAYLEGVPVADFTIDAPVLGAVGLMGGEFDEIRIGAYSAPLSRNLAYQNRDERAHQALAIDNVRYGIIDAPLLTVAATCPEGGPIRIEWSGATWRGEAALVFARTQGSFVIPDGHPCAGTRLGLGLNEIQLVWRGSAGSNGSRTLNATTGPGPCGGYVQVIDLSVCTTSDAVQVK